MNSESFASARRLDAGGSEYWSARDLMGLFQYTRWSNFKARVILKAVEFCDRMGIASGSHIHCTAEIVKHLQSKGSHSLADYRLSAIACYCIAQQADHRSKPMVAIAREYFSESFFARDSATKQLELNLSDSAPPVIAPLETTLDPIAPAQASPTNEWTQQLMKTAEVSDLSQIWERVLPEVRPLGTQVLLKLHGQLVAFSNHAVYIRITSQPLLNMVKDKVANIEAAFSQVFDRQITVRLGLENTIELQEKNENSWSAAIVAGDPQVLRATAELDLQSSPPIDKNQIEGGFKSPQIELRSLDGYVNATKLASEYQKTTGSRKAVADWLRQKRTQEMMTHLSSVTGIPITNLYQVIQGGSVNEQGTWLHPRLSVRFGMWLSDDFGLVVESKVEEWLRGGVRPHPAQTPTPLQLLAQTVQAIAEFEQKQLAVNEKLEGDLQAVKEQVDAVRTELEEGLEQLKSDRELAQDDDNLVEFHSAKEVPPTVSQRNSIVWLVRRHCKELEGFLGRKLEDIEWEQEWDKVYTTVKYQWRYDVKARVKNYNINPDRIGKKRNNMDQFEADGMLEKVHMTVTKLFYPKPHTEQN